MSCFGGHEEQIYLIEILIDKLTLTPDKIKDIGQNHIVIKIKLLDFPVFEIMREDSSTTKVGPHDQDNSIRFTVGKCYIFIKRPQDLVRELRSTKAKIGVFCVGDTYPVAETELILPGCLCDQIAMLKNDPKNLPKPFTVKGGYHLLDPGENPSGMLHMELSVVCLGRLFMPAHQLHAKSFVSGEEDKDREICMKRFVPSEFLGDSTLQDTLPQTEITLTPETGKPAKAKKKKKIKGDKKKKKEKK